MKIPTSLKIGIAGAGSAGLSVAIAFARLGHHVTLFEKHPGIAPLGAGLLIQPQGIRALGELGVRQEFEARSVSIERLLGLSHRGWRVVDIRYERNLARAVSRDKLSAVLLEAATRLGVNIRFASEVHSLDTLGDRAVVSTTSGETAFDLFVIADGATSRLRTAAGLARPATVYPWGALWGQFWIRDWQTTTVLQQRYRGPRQMMGLMPTEISPQGVWLSLFSGMRCDEQPFGKTLHWTGGRQRPLFSGRKRNSFSGRFARTLTSCLRPTGIAGLTGLQMDRSWPSVTPHTR
ncbi:FAD-dependent oxidoreductase [Burkholderia cenocepacia]|uniref:FAD-dependent oxidoreductase n=1 Tax=Burkholderia cenocepacia TaxID=95486 RepID=UPI000AAD9443|nr:NAD(P)/FAD-dependent oxidoreductase [Burkholderia cenocepacia]